MISEVLHIEGYVPQKISYTLRLKYLFCDTWEKWIWLPVCKILKGKELLVKYYKVRG